MRRLAGILLIASISLPVLADTPDTSLRPVARTERAKPAGPTVLVDTDAGIFEVVRMRPPVRPLSEQEQEMIDLSERVAFVSPTQSMRPWARPLRVEQKAMAQRRLRRQGAVCGDIELQGDDVGRVPGRIKGCGVKDAVRLRSVSGVKLSQAALINCRTASALKNWVDKGVQPAFADKGPVVELRVAAHYACRPRNNQRGAKISEHGRGNAIDISGFVMQSGEVVTVIEDWTGKGPLNTSHRAACGTFKTVLGPRSDRFHQDHFHLDMANHRGGAYCR